MMVEAGIKEANLGKMELQNIRDLLNRTSAVNYMFKSALSFNYICLNSLTGAVILTQNTID